ncbi:MAG: hypothetical protein D6677_08605 [Calditrichaeota bacterium]|nr:MAG: hypothetical protein D6677_08605 [Calditrichota bacterium]
MFSLRPVLKEGQRIPLNEKVPVYLYVPPYEIGKGYYYYCILDNQEPASIYKTYKIPHYYVISIKIQ